MEAKSFQSRDPDLEGSFSFSSCYDFNSSSSLKIFSDNDHSDENEDDEESYIEIALEPTHHVRRLDNDAGGGECTDDEMELRISFSSCFQLPTETKPLEFFESANSCKSSVSSSSSSSSSSSIFIFSSTPAENQRNKEVEVKPIIEKSLRSKVQFPAVNPLISSFRVSAEIDLADGGMVATSHLELLRPTSNSTSRITSTAINNGMIMKLFIKFRALKLRTLIASLMKVPQSQGIKTNAIEKSPTERKQRKSSNLFGNGEKQSKFFELKLDAIRGVLESIGGKDRRTKSCPGSTNSSPIHHQRLWSQSYKMCANDNSLQAAIAHCKKSVDPNV